VAEIFDFARHSPNKETESRHGKVDECMKNVAAEPLPTDYFQDFSIESLRVSSYRRMVMTIFHTINLVK
jgi:hypothetical protein